MLNQRATHSVMPKYQILTNIQYKFVVLLYKKSLMSYEDLQFVPAGPAGRCTILILISILSHVLPRWRYQRGWCVFFFLHLDFGLLEKLYWNNSQYYLDSNKGGSLEGFSRHSRSNKECVLAGKHPIVLFCEPF